MASISQNVYIEKLDYIINKYKNTYHKTIKMKPADVKSSTYTEFDKKNKKNDPKFQVADNVRIAKYKNIFIKVHVPNWSEEVFMIKKVKNTVPWTYDINDLETFYEKELQKINQNEFTVEKVIKRKGDKLYVKWKAMIILLTVELKK